MRRFIISEERLKKFIRRERELYYAHDSMFYCPSDEELEPTEEDLEEFTEIKETDTDFIDVQKNR